MIYNIHRVRITASDQINYVIDVIARPISTYMTCIDLHLKIKRKENKFVFANKRWGKIQIEIVNAAYLENIKMADDMNKLKLFMNMNKYTNPGNFMTRSSMFECQLKLVL